MEDSDGQIKTLLIVEDELDLREFLQSEVQRLGYKALTASDGREGLLQVATHKVHAVLCDIFMPNMDGKEFLRELRARGIELPFIFLTGDESRASLVDAIRLEATDFLCKPFDLAELSKAIERALEIGARQAHIEVSMSRLKTQNDDMGVEVRRIERQQEQIRRLKRHAGPGSGEA